MHTQSKTDSLLITHGKQKVGLPRWLIVKNPPAMQEMWV